MGQPGTGRSTESWAEKGGGGGTMSEATEEREGGGKLDIRATGEETGGLEGEGRGEAADTPKPGKSMGRGKEVGKAWEKTREGGDGQTVGDGEGGIGDWGRREGRAWTSAETRTSEEGQEDEEGEEQGAGDEGKEAETVTGEEGWQVAAR